MIQNPPNKYTILPEHEGIALDNRSENSASSFTNANGQNSFQSQQGELVVQGERVALDIVNPIIQSADYDDRELVHEYSDYGFGYRYRRIRKEKVGPDGIKEDEDEVEVDDLIFTKELGLEEMYLWTLKFSFYSGIFMWPFFILLHLYIRLVPAFRSRDGMIDWEGFIFGQIVYNLGMLAVTLWQRRNYRNALMNKDYKEGKRYLRGLALEPIVFLLFGLILTLVSVIA